MTRLQAVQPLDGFRLALTWAGGRRSEADLSGLVQASRHFKIFARTPDAFREVSVINWGHGVGWANGLDYSAENLAVIAEEQAEDSGARLIETFKQRFNLTNDQLARALGFSANQIKNYRFGKSPVNYAVRRAVRDMLDNPAILYARLGRNRTKTAE